MMTDKKFLNIVEKMETRYLDPTNDVAFKKIFSDQDRLRDFLNAVLRLQPGHLIQEINIVSQEELPEMSTGRRSIFDIKCKDETGSIYVVEMQNRPEDAYLNRVQCYASHTYASQIQKGHMHSTLMPVIMLSITNKILFNDTEVECINYHWNVESKTGKRYLMALSYVFIELPKFTKKGTELDSKEDEWLYFFANWNKTKAPPQTVHDPLVLAAYKTIERFNWSEEEYDTYFRARLAAEAEEITLTKSFQEGKIEGLQEGENIKATKTVLKMAKMGIDLKLISEATELTFEEVETIIRNEK